MTNTNRRHFISLLGRGGTLAYVSSIALSTSVHADDTIALDPDSAAAKALQFTVKSAKHGQNCENCLFYSSIETAATGMCMVFNGNLVPAGGWCKAFQVSKSM